MAKLKRDKLEEILLTLDEPATLSQVQAHFGEETGIEISKDYVRKIVKELGEKGRINVEKEATEKYVILKVQPKE